MTKQYLRQDKIYFRIRLQYIKYKLQYKIQIKMTDSEIREKEVDFYQLLGVSQEATIDEIEERYIKLSLLHHPDKGGDAQKYRMMTLAPANTPQHQQLQIALQLLRYRQ